MSHSSTDPPPGDSFIFIGERLWLDFINTDDVRHGVRVDALRDFGGLVRWLEAAEVLDAERAAAMLRRARQQPAGAGAALADARRVRAALRALAERGSVAEDARRAAVSEINRVLGRSTGTRRLEPREDGSFIRSFVLVGDAFAGLTIPMVESAADALVLGELSRVRRCADPVCSRVFHDGTKNGRRRWCAMDSCGNRAKAARHRRKISVERDAAGTPAGTTAGMPADLTGGTRAGTTADAAGHHPGQRGAAAAVSARGGLM